MIHYGTVDDTTWPIDWSTDDEDSAQWTLRYGTPERREDQRYSVASVLAAYGHLLDPGLSMKEATMALRRARRVSADIWEAAPPDPKEPSE